MYGNVVQLRAPKPGTYGARFLALYDGLTDQQKEEVMLKTKTHGVRDQISRVTFLPRLA